MESPKKISPEEMINYFGGSQNVRILKDMYPEDLISKLEERVKARELRTEDKDEILEQNKITHIEIQHGCNQAKVIEGLNDAELQDMNLFFDYPSSGTMDVEEAIKKKCKSIPNWRYDMYFD